MYESAAETEALQALIDRSYLLAGAHIQSIHTKERRMSATAVCELLQGVRVLNLATVSKQNAPFVAPVDGLFFRGRFWFGSAQDSLRFRHIRDNPRVSAAYTEGESVSVIVHGTAHEIDTSSGGHDDLHDLCVEIYGDKFDTWGYWGKNPYAWLEADRFYAIEIQP